MIFAAIAEFPALFIAVVFLLSLVIGSFLNVVIHRLPIMMDRQWRQQAEEMLASPPLGAVSGIGDPGSQPANRESCPQTTDHGPQPQDAAAPHPAYNLMVPRSACPHCGAQIAAWQNIPVVSYLLLRGRCANCQSPISARYPIVEFGTAALSAVVAWRFGVTPFTLAALVLTWSLIALTVIDIDHQLLPDSITLPLVWLGLLISVAAISGSRGYPVDLKSAVVGAMAGYLTLWLVYHAFRLLTGKEGMGFGDFKLFAALGAWLGWQLLPLVILLSAATGAVVGIALIVLRGRDRNVPIPFGPYLAAAGWIALLWGREIVDIYLRGTGMQ
jgi:leader peptidase (prepilin peptidase)/N-methyltransferase